MVDGSCRICRYSRGFVYGWYHTVTRHKVYEVLYLFAVFKIEHIQIKVTCQNNMLFHCVILCKVIFKVVFTSFYISIRGSQIVLKLIFLHLLFKISMLRYSPLLPNLCPNLVDFWRTATRVQIYLSLYPCDSFLSDIKHYNQVVGLKNYSPVYCRLPRFLRSRLYWILD